MRYSTSKALVVIKANRVRHLGLMEGIGTEGIISVAQAMQANTSITWMDFGRGNNISDRTVSAVVNMLQKNHTITRLDFRIADLANTGLAELAAALKNHPSCTELTIQCSKGNEALIQNTFSDNNNLTVRVISDRTPHVSAQDRIKMYPDYIEHQRFLKKTSIDNISFGPDQLTQDDVLAIAALIENDTMCQKIDVSYCELDDEGIKILAQAMHSNTECTFLDLSFNQISDASAAALAEMLSKNPRLKTLHIFDNAMTEKGAAILDRAIRKHASLEDVQITKGQNRVAAVRHQEDVPSSSSSNSSDIVAEESSSITPLVVEEPTSSTPLAVTASKTPSASSVSDTLYDIASGAIESIRPYAKPLAVFAAAGAVAFFASMALSSSTENSAGDEETFTHGL